MRLMWKYKYEIDDSILEKNIIEMEETYKIKFPEIYKNMIREKSTTVLSSDVMMKGYTDPTDRYSLEFESFDFNEEYNFKSSNIRNSDVRPKGLVFFWSTSGGEHYGFDFKDNPDNPKIVYYNHSIVPPRDNFEEDGIFGDKIDEEQRKLYEVRYDNIEEFYNHLEVAQKYWIEEEYGSEDSEELKEYIKDRCV